MATYNLDSPLYHSPQYRGRGPSPKFSRSLLLSDAMETVKDVGVIPPFRRGHFAIRGHSYQRHFAGSSNKRPNTPRYAPHAKFPAKRDIVLLPPRRHVFHMRLFQQIRVDPHAETSVHPLSEVGRGNAGVETFDEARACVDVGGGAEGVFVLDALGLHLDAEDVEGVAEGGGSHSRQGACER